MTQIETTCEHGTKIIMMDGGVSFDNLECWHCAKSKKEEDKKQNSKVEKNSPFDRLSNILDEVINNHIASQEILKSCINDMEKLIKRRIIND